MEQNLYQTIRVGEGMRHYFGPVDDIYFMATKNKIDGSLSNIRMYIGLSAFPHGGTQRDNEPGVRFVEGIKDLFSEDDTVKNKKNLGILNKYLTNLMASDKGLQIKYLDELKKANKDDPHPTHPMVFFSCAAELAHHDMRQNHASFEEAYEAAPHAHKADLQNLWDTLMQQNNDIELTLGHGSITIGGSELSVALDKLCAANIAFGESDVHYMRTQMDEFLEKEGITDLGELKPVYDVMVKHDPLAKHFSPRQESPAIA